jgi:hypothetical protein
MQPESAFGKSGAGLRASATRGLGVGLWGLPKRVPGWLGDGSPAYARSFLALEAIPSVEASSLNPPNTANM